MHEDKDLRWLGLVEDLVGALNHRNVDYCHWKSNWDLASALSGDGDLDLFVDRRSLPGALCVLASLGFKPAVEGRGPKTPGTSHHYGLDPQSGKIIHVHLYTMLLTGESRVKSHRFPFETMLLENRSTVGPLKVASKPAELVLHVLRTFIKYGAFADAMGLRRKPEGVHQELRWLQTSGDTSEALSLLRKHCPTVDETLFLKCIDALDVHGSLARRVRLAVAIRWRLRIYARHGWLARLMAHAHMRWTRSRGRLSGVRRNRSLQSGGAVIALVGGDATGKSTLVSETARWLARPFAVRTVHAGKPPATWLTVPVRVAWPLVRPLLPSRRREPVASGSDGVGPKEDHRSLFRAIQAVTLAWDRRRLLIKTRRHSANGEIVICDRYPSDTIGAMDSPRLRESPIGNGRKVALRNWLARVEHRLYAQIPPPDVVVRLSVSLETAKQRNLDRTRPDKETDDYFEARHRQGGAWSKSGTRSVCDIDTNGPLDETVLRVKKAIWQSL